MKLIMQRYGDRGGNVGSIRDYAHTIPANPMSDQIQMAMEVYERDNELYDTRQLASARRESPCEGGVLPLRGND